MASVSDKTAEGSVNVFFNFFFSISAINVLKHIYSFFSFQSVHYSLDMFLELS